LGKCLWESKISIFFEQGHTRNLSLILENPEEDPEEFPEESYHTLVKDNTTGSEASEERTSEESIKEKSKERVIGKTLLREGSTPRSLEVDFQATVNKFE
jgi:hypothetical protein